MARNKAERQAALAENTNTENTPGVEPTEPQTEPTPAPTGDGGETKTAKSIVPSKYAGRYKGGGSDPVANFIKQEAGEGDKFAFDSFFELCRVNGIDGDKIEHYRGQIADERQGAKGRARMTLGNMLRAKARHDGKLIKLDGTEEALSVPKPTLSGAAAAAKEANTQTSAAEGQTTEGGGTEQVPEGASEATGDVPEGESAQYYFRPIPRLVPKAREVTLRAFGV